MRLQCRVPELLNLVVVDHLARAPRLNPKRREPNKLLRWSNARRAERWVLSTNTSHLARQEFATRHKRTTGVRFGLVHSAAVVGVDPWRGLEETTTSSFVMQRFQTPGVDDREERLHLAPVPRAPPVASVLGLVRVPPIRPLKGRFLSKAFHASRYRPSPL